MNGSRHIRKDTYYYSMLVLPTVFFLLFNYLPIAGNYVAFSRYRIGMGLFEGDWVGLRYFELAFRNASFWRALRNNLVLSAMNVFLAFPVPILFAILLNELRAQRVKKIAQTVSYLPHFLSLVVVTGMIQQFLSPTTGALNALIEQLGGERIFFMQSPGWFRPVFVISGIWQHMGWNAIIYLAALAGIDPQLYEAASIDGAGRVRKILSISIPSIAPAIIITFILAVGRMLQVGFQKVLLLYNPITRETADILSTFVYRMGIEQGNFSFATAVGLFESIIGLLLVVSANALSRRLTEASLW